MNFFRDILVLHRSQDLVHEFGFPFNFTWRGCRFLFKDLLIEDAINKRQEVEFIFVVQLTELRLHHKINYLL